MFWDFWPNIWCRSQYNDLSTLLHSIASASHVLCMPQTLSSFVQLHFFQLSLMSKATFCSGIRIHVLWRVLVQRSTRLIYFCWHMSGHWAASAVDWHWWVHLLWRAGENQVDASREEEPRATGRQGRMSEDQLNNLCTRFILIVLFFTLNPYPVKLDNKIHSFTCQVCFSLQRILRQVNKEYKRSNVPTEHIKAASSGDSDRWT